MAGRISGVLRIDHDADGNIKTVEAGLTGIVHRDGNGWTAYCRELDLASCGDTADEAIAAIKEAITLWFEYCISKNALERALSELGWVCQGPDKVIEDCKKTSLPSEILPAFMINELTRQDTGWSTSIRFGD